MSVIHPGITHAADGDWSPGQRGRHVHCYSGGEWERSSSSLWYLYQLQPDHAPKQKFLAPIKTTVHNQTPKERNMIIPLAKYVGSKPLITTTLSQCHSPQKTQTLPQGSPRFQSLILLASNWHILKRYVDFTAARMMCCFGAVWTRR